MKTINELTIDNYFSRLNNGDYMIVAELFSEQGCLHPPFEKPVCGRNAIAQYLKAEAKGMIACPEFTTISDDDFGNVCYQVKGKVKTSFFTVNVSWLIQLNAEQEILMVRVKLLNELQDLLALKMVQP